MHIEIPVDEGHKYYFGNITWSGNTKYSDSLLTVLLGIKKGDTYNSDILEQKTRHYYFTGRRRHQRFVHG